MDVVEEEGYVAEISGQRAQVVVERTRAKVCEHCGLCFRRPDGSYQVEAVAEVPARPGDRVVLRIEQPGALTITVAVFLVPAAALVAGLVLGGYLSKGLAAGEWRDLIQAMLGLGGAGLAFLGLYLYDRRLRARRRKQPPRIVRVLEPGPGEPAAPAGS